MKWFLAILILLFSTGINYSQSSQKSLRQQDIFTRLTTTRDGAGEVIIIQDQQLKDILLKYVELNQQSKGIPCFWVRIYSGSGHGSREQAYQVKAGFMQKFEGFKSEVIYDDPNFKVYVGGYRVKSDALKLLNKIKGNYPSAFIIYEAFDFPEL